MDNGIDLTGLPALPQTAFLHHLVPALWQRPDVLGIWLEGSLGRGNADRYSDVDLYVGVEPTALEEWRVLDVPQLFGNGYAAHFFSNFAADFFVYHVYLLAGGIYDLHIQPRNRKLPQSQRLILGCREEDYRAELTAATPDPAMDPALLFAPQALTADVIAGLLIFFWINVDKSRKVLYRRQDFTCYTGLHLFRQIVARLLFMEQTDTDCGDLMRSTIHGLKAAAAVLGQALGDDLGQIMGAPTRTRAELAEAQARLCGEVARVGRVLAARHAIPYPEPLEQVILQNWRDFIATDLYK